MPCCTFNGPPQSPKGKDLPPNKDNPTPKSNSNMCPMCSNSLTDEKVLPCSHSICGTCFNNHRWSGVLICPVCRHKHKIDTAQLLGEASLERFVLDLIQTSSSDVVNAEREIWNNNPRASSSTSTNSPPIPSSSPITNANDANNGNSISRPFEETGAIPKVRNMPINQMGHQASSANNVPSPTAISDVNCGAASSVSQFNDLLFPKENVLEPVTIPPLSPVVGGETRTPKATLPLRLCPNSPILTEPNRNCREKSTIDLPTCIHGRSVEEYYCTLCIVVFCGQCVSDHQTHRFTPFHEATNLLRVILHDMLRETQSRESDVEASFLHSQSILENLRVNRSTAEVEIEYSIRNVLDIVEKRRNQLLLNLKRIHSLKADILLRQIQTLRNAKSHLMMMGKGILSKLESTDTEELISTHFIINDNLKKMEHLALQLSPQEDSTLSYNSSLKGIKEQLDIFGIINSMAYAPNTKAYGTNTEVALISTPSYISVRCFDHMGEKRTSGGDDIQVRLIFPSGRKVLLAVKDYENGDYTAMFVSHEQGEHTLIVTLRGLPISNSVLKPMVRLRRPYKDIKYPPLETFGKGPSSQTSLSRGWGVHCDRDGTIYITERDIHCVLIFGPNLNFIRKFGQHGDRDGELNRPAGITVDIFRRIIVVDKDNHRIQIFTIGGEFLSRFGRRGSGTGEFQYPWDVDTNSKGQILVSDSRNHRVQLFDKDGTLLICSDETLGKCNFKLLEIPRGVCFDTQGNMYVADFNNHHILILSPKMQLVNSIGRYGDTEGMFFRPQGICVDAKGYIFVVESKNNRAQIYTPNRKFVSMITSTDRKETFAPCDVTVSPDGFFYFVDIELGCVYKM